MNNRSGFTLLEVLVALMLLSLLATTSYRALGSVLGTESHVRSDQVFWDRLARFCARIEDDLANGVAVPLVTTRPGVFVASRTSSGDASFSLSRQSADNAGGGVVQVQYAYAGGKLTRMTGTFESAAGGLLQQVVLEGLAKAVFRYMDASGRWLADWSPAAAELPRAVEVSVTWPDGRQLRRVFRTS